MNRLPEQYREFEQKRFLFRDGAETPDLKKGVEAIETRISEDPSKLAEMQPEELAAEIRRRIEEKFPPNDYENSDYEKIVAAAYRRIEARVFEYVSQRAEAIEASRVSQERLSALIESPKAAGTREVLGGNWTFKIPIVGPLFEHVDLPILSPIITNRGYLEHKEFSAKVKEIFLKELIPALGAQYSNMDWQRQHLTEKDFDEYKDLAEEFQDGMEEHVGRQLDFILKNSPNEEALKKGLEDLRNETVERYKRYARDDGFIDLPELRGLKREAEACVDLARVVNSGGSDEEIIKKIEGMDFLGRDRWVQTSKLWANEMVRTIEANGGDQAFIEAVKKASGKEGEMTFDQASDRFKDMIAERAEIGIRETLQLAREVNVAANGRHAEILRLEEGIPDSIRPMVDVEREKLIRRITIPKNVDDRLLVDFVRGFREDRDGVLSNPTQRLALFQAVKNVLAREQAREWNQRIRNLPKKTGGLTPERRPEKIFNHDELARHLALIVMAKEAQATIESLDKAKQYERQNLLEAYKDMEAEKAPPPSDLRFRDINKLYSTRYVSEAARAGFNGKSIGLFLLATWGLATAAVNSLPVLNKLRQGKIDEALAALKNPYLLLGAGTVYGIKKVKENPAFAQYPWEGRGGQERILQHSALNSMAKKVGRERLVSFVADGAEFKLMESMFEKFKGSPSARVKELKRTMDAARKHKGDAVPTLTKEELRGEERPTVPRGPAQFQRDRIRYLFYEKLLLEPEVSIRALRDNCNSWLGA